MKASALAKHLGYDMFGDDAEISGISYYDEAVESEIAVAFSRKELLQTKARVVLTHPVLMPTSKTLIMTYDDLGMALFRVCRELVKSGIIEDCQLPVHLKMNEKGYYTGIDVFVSESAAIHPNVIIGNNVLIGDGCIVEPFAVIGSGTILSAHVFVGSGSKIGAESFYHFKNETGTWNQFMGYGKTIIGEGTHIGSHTIIERGTISDTVIGKNCMIGNGIDIGHDVKIGNHCKIVSQTGIAGKAVLKNNVIIYGQVGVSNDVVIGNNAVVKAKTVVSKSVEDNQIVFGIFGRSYSEEMKLTAKIRHFFGGKGDV